MDVTIRLDAPLLLLQTQPLFVPTVLARIHPVLLAELVARTLIIRVQLVRASSIRARIGPFALSQRV